MSNLCSGASFTMVVMKEAYDVFKKIAGGKGSPVAEENEMVDVGKDYARELANNPDKPDTASIRKTLQKRYADNPHHETETACKLQCRLTDAQKNALRKQKFGYHLYGMTGHQK